MHADAPGGSAADGLSRRRRAVHEAKSPMFENAIAARSETTRLDKYRQSKDRREAMFCGSMRDLGRADVDHRIFEHQQTLSTLGDGQQRTVYIGGNLNLDVLDIDPDHLGRGFYRLDRRSMDGVAGVPDNGDTGETRNQFLE
jgi:hypothetical protein